MPFLKQFDIGCDHPHCDKVVMVQAKSEEAALARIAAYGWTVETRSYPIMEVGGIGGRGLVCQQVDHCMRCPEHAFAAKEKPNEA